MGFLFSGKADEPAMRENALSTVAQNSAGTKSGIRFFILFEGTGKTGELRLP
jgi:hypothetical protein